MVFVLKNFPFHILTATKAFIDSFQCFTSSKFCATLTLVQRTPVQSTGFYLSKTKLWKARASLEWFLYFLFHYSQLSQAAFCPRPKTSTITNVSSKIHVLELIPIQWCWKVGLYRRCLSHKTSTYERVLEEWILSLLFVPLPHEDTVCLSLALLPTAMRRHKMALTRPDVGFLTLDFPVSRTMRK